MISPAVMTHSKRPGQIARTQAARAAEAPRPGFGEMLHSCGDHLRHRRLSQWAPDGPETPGVPAIPRVFKKNQTDQANKADQMGRNSPVCPQCGTLMALRGDELDARTILRLQMLDLFPMDVLGFLKQHFRERFESLDGTGRLALATILTEQRLTHARLSELTGHHPSDVTKALRGLVDNGFFVSEGMGQGTVYRFKGTPKITSEDVFSDEGFPDSDTSSPDLGASSPDLPASYLNLGASFPDLPASYLNMDAGSPDLSMSYLNLGIGSSDLSPSYLNLEQGTMERDEWGRLISPHFLIPFIDRLAALHPDYVARLHQLASEPQKSKKISRERMAEVLVDLCEGHYIRLDCLVELVRRRANTLQSRYLSQLCREQRLRMAFPDTPTDPRQAYTKA